MEEVLEYDNLAGNHISNVAAGALALAIKEQKRVHFEFNGTDVLVEPTDSRDGVVKRWETDYEAAAKAYREHPDRIKEAEEQEREDKAARAAHMIETAQTEADMRDAKAPWPLTKEQLTEYIESLANRKDHSYGTCVYAVSLAATATFNYMAGQLGITGFQSGCADFDILRRTRHMDGPFILLKGEDALYPQYDLPAKLENAMEEWKPWLKEQAEIKLRGSHEHTHPSVLAHWKELAEANVPSVTV